MGNSKILGGSFIKLSICLIFYDKKAYTYLKERLSVNKYVERSKNNYNKAADKFDRSFEAKLTLPFKKKLVSLISMEENSKVLDVGCATGTLLNILSQEFSFEGYGTDISENMIKNAQIKYPSMRFETAFCENIPFDSAIFDRITLSLAYHHFPNGAEFAKEAHRLLKPKGLIYIAEMYSPPFLRDFLNIFVSRSPAGCIKIFSPEEISQTFINLGFVTHSFTQSGFMQVLVLQKV